MAGNNSIQFLRGSSAARKASSQTLLAGQPFYEMDTNSLYVGGSNGTSLTAATPVNSYYDTIIHNQTEFEAWYKQLDAGTYTGASVLICNGSYTRSDGKGLHLPKTLRQLQGLGKAAISIDNFRPSSQNPGGIWVEDNKEEFMPYRIDGIGLFLQVASTLSMEAYGFYNCTNLSNCVSTISGGGLVNKTIAAFHKCARLVNCYGLAQDTDNTSQELSGFHNCTQLSNCIGYGSGRSYGYGFYTCSICSNCIFEPDFLPKTAAWGGTNKNVDPNTCPEYTT